MATKEELVARSTLISISCKKALEWCLSSTDDGIHSDKILIKELRTAVVTAERLKYAAQSKMAVGVFGPSQAGKSYLISALARSSDGTLLSSFADKKEDFIAKINPEGGKESTGLVTRFTYNPEKKLPPIEFPVQVGLLTESDVIKILANSFVEDIIHPNDQEVEDHQVAIEKSIVAAKSRSNSGSGIAVEDMYDLENYVQINLLKNSRMSALRRYGYWQSAIELGPTLSSEARIDFFSALWEEDPTYTEIYCRLQTQLIKFGNNRQINCHPAALFEIDDGKWKRSKKSIIDVATLENLCESGGDLVTVQVPNGGQIEIERSELAALVSELIINLAVCPHPFFIHTDLLDFPGARSRQPQPIESIKEREVRAENFLRGKVAYLFERYSADRELSAMLLCVGPSNQEVVGLGDQIERWIELTHGTTPEERNKVPCTLLFVLTKFDTAFAQGAGQSLDGTRWSIRLEASLLKPFGAHSHRTKWVSHWDSSGKFKNLFWLRNPNFRQDALFNYEENSVCQELSIRPDKEAFINELRAAFLSNQVVNEHFSNPTQAWDKSLVLNDGGISRIIESIEPICQPSVKLDQVEQQISILATRVFDLLSRYYISSDIAELRKQKTELATQILTSLGRAMQRGHLGEFISSLKLDDSYARDAYYQSERAAAPTSSITQAHDENLADEGIDENLADILGLPSNENTQSPIGSATVSRDFPVIYAENIILSWLSYITEQSRDANLINYFGISPQVFLNIAREFEVSARRSGVFDQMAIEVRKNRGFMAGRKATWVWKQIAPVTNRFNDFIDHAGNVVTAVSGCKTKTLVGAEITVFDTTEIENPMSRLTEESMQYEKKYLTDWLQGLQTTIRLNAEYLGGLTGNAESNARLGEILETLRSQR
jgi:hypothetical protein